MGISGKKLLLIGGCAIGGIIAAPAVVTVATSTLLLGAGGAIATSAAEALIFASSASVAAGGAAAGAVVGTAINAKQEKDEQKLADARREGYKAASIIYEEKFKKQADAFIKKEKSFENNTNEYKELIADMQEYIDELEASLSKEADKNDFLEAQIEYIKGKMNEVKGANAMK